MGSIRGCSKNRHYDPYYKSKIFYSEIGLKIVADCQNNDQVLHAS